MALLLDFPPPTEGVHHCEPNTRAVFGEKDLGKGTLYIAESVVCWSPMEEGGGRGFSLRYQSVFMHAVSTDVNNYPQPCLLLVLDGNIAMDSGDANGDSGDQLAEAIDAMNVEEEEDEYEKTNELRFVPDNRNMLDVMFRAMLDCQALNPDPDELEDDGNPNYTPINPSGLSRLNFPNSEACAGCCMDDDGVVVAPSFNIQVANGGELDEEYEDYEEEEEDQFEDAES